jgi:hypothetical protein
MPIAALQGKGMLPGEGCDPNVVGWNRLAFALQFEGNSAGSLPPIRIPP